MIYQRKELGFSIRPQRNTNAIRDLLRGCPVLSKAFLLGFLFFPFYNQMGWCQFSTLPFSLSYNAAQVQTGFPLSRVILYIYIYIYILKKSNLVFKFLISIFKSHQFFLSFNKSLYQVIVELNDISFATCAIFNTSCTRC